MGIGVCALLLMVHRWMECEGMTNKKVNPSYSSLLARRTSKESVAASDQSLACMCILPPHSHMIPVVRNISLHEFHIMRNIMQDMLCKTEGQVVAGLLSAIHGLLHIDSVNSRRTHVCQCPLHGSLMGCSYLYASHYLWVLFDVQVHLDQLLQCLEPMQQCTTITQGVV